MPNGDLHCVEHSGCIARIEHLENAEHELRERMDKIFMRLNIILGGVVVACVMLAVNTLAK